MSADRPYPLEPDCAYSVREKMPLHTLVREGHSRIRWLKVHCQRPKHGIPGAGRTELSLLSDFCLPLPVVSTGLLSVDDTASPEALLPAGIRVTALAVVSVSADPENAHLAVSDPKGGSEEICRQTHGQGRVQMFLYSTISTQKQ